MITGLIASLLVPTAVGGGVGVFLGVFGKALAIKKAVNNTIPLLRKIQPDLSQEELDELARGFAYQTGRF